ncbi:MAG: ATP-binding cassette domain-containing protein, partial [Acidimicrobiia bacterium]|nr:ATP-binding cassette domain-containing protein [Acidimicrobiia bacterium]
FWLALDVALVTGTVFGAAVELSVVRRLFTAPRVILLVATVGVAQLAQAIVAAYPDIDATANQYPVAIGTTWEDVLGLRIRGPQVAIIIIVPIVAVALGWVLNRTTFGKAVSASADNPDLSRLSGVNPKYISTFVWTIAGLLSTVSMILLSGQSGSVTGIVSLGPLTLGKAMVAAVIAGMRSFPRAVAAGVLIGITEAIIRFNFFEDPGLIDFILFVAVVIAVYLESRSSTDEGVFAFAPKVRSVPARLQGLWWVRNLDKLVLGAFLIAAVALPLIVTLPSRHLLYSTILCFAICAASLTVITGWSGQLSLSQMTFAGLGALIAASLNRGLEMDIGWRGTRIVDFEAGGIPFALSIVVAAVIVAGIAAIIGVGALRVRGLMLAVTTFVFAIAAQQYIFRRPIFTDGRTGSVPFSRGELFGIDLSSQRTYYYVCLGVLVVVLVVLARLRRSGVGRSTIAVRDNPDTASAYTISPARMKLSAFALAGGIAALGGGLLAGLVENVPATERFFLVGDSLRLVGMVVIGGLGSLMGPVLGALWIEGLPAFFRSNELVPLFTSSVGLLIILMYVPGGFVQIGHAARDALFDWMEGRLPPAPPVESATTPPASVVAGHRAEVPDIILAATDIEVHFGGNFAVTGASITVGRDEIIGLIGTNGAGKSTLMNAIGGYVPATGRVELLGRDISRLRPAKRARHGLGRTFQAALLFPELTVRETVQVALEGRRRTPFMATAMFLPPSGSIERTRRNEADELIDFLGLGRYADSYVSDLSTGTRRIVELAGLLALDAQLLCLDEPTAGVAQRETEAFGPLLVEIRRELGAAMLIIEHDMPLIMAMSDRVYCLELGTVISEGEPHEVRNDPAVIASYLGTDERAIARSDMS